MLVDTRKTIHMAVNFVVTPTPALDADLRLGVQRFLDQADVAYSTVNLTEQALVIQRGKPDRLEIRINQNQPGVGQLMIAAPWPERTLESFVGEAGVIVGLLDTLAPPDKRRLVARAASLRELYDTGGVHAFQEIWESILTQQPEALQSLGRPVRGGGLRFVMPPMAGEDDPATIELKVESYLKDTAKIFIDVRLSWAQPSEVGAVAAPGELLGRVDDFITQTVWSFMHAEE